MHRGWSQHFELNRIELVLGLYMQMLVFRINDLFAASFIKTSEYRCYFLTALPLCRFFVCAATAPSPKRIKQTFLNPWITKEHRFSADLSAKKKKRQQKQQEAQTTWEKSTSCVIKKEIKDAVYRLYTRTIYSSTLL